MHYLADKVTGTVAAWLMLMPGSTTAQQETSTPHSKIQYALEVGAGGSLFPWEATIGASGPLAGDSKVAQYAGFTKVPAFSCDAGIRAVLPLGRRWAISSGVLFALRNIHLERSQDIVSQHMGYVPNMRRLADAYEYRYQYYDIEIPLRVHFMPGKTSVVAGFNFAPVAYKTARYKYLVWNGPGYGDTRGAWQPASKTVHDFALPLHVFAVAQVEYLLALSKFELSPFVGAQYAINNFQELLFRAGVVIPFSRTAAMASSPQNQPQ